MVSDRIKKINQVAKKMVERARQREQSQAIEKSGQRANEMLEAPIVLKEGSVDTLKDLPNWERAVADRWAAGWPKATKQLEAEGRLIEAVKEQAAREKAILSDARAGGENSHLTDREILEMYDVTPRPPA